MTQPKQPQATPEPGAEAELEPEQVEQPGAGEPPQAEPGEGKKPPAERTYSQREWSERESAKDQEIAQAQQAASQAAMQAQIAQQAQAEATAQAKDRSDIDQGLITQAEATQRQQQRQQAQQQVLQAQQRAMQMQPKMEELGRMMAAQDMGKRHGVNPYELLNDKALTTPEQMEAKAKELAKTVSDDKIANLEVQIQALKNGEPFYDQGQAGSAGSAVEKMTAEEKIKYGLAHPVKPKKPK